MKKIFVLTLSIFICATTFAQDTTIVYFNFFRKQVSKEKAYTWAKKYRVGQYWGLTRYSKVGIIVSKETFSDESCTKREGVEYLYDEQGKLRETITYSDDKLSGPDIVYYNSGEKEMEGNNKTDKREGDWIGYYKSGKIFSKAHYANNVQISGSYFNEDGSPNENIDSFLRRAEFPGGQQSWMKFLARNLIYPAKAQDKEIQGTSVIVFTVSPDGTAKDYMVWVSSDPSLDEEALRIVSLVPKWTPAIIGGKFSEARFRQPITFKLEVGR